MAKCLIESSLLLIPVLTIAETLCNIKKMKKTQKHSSAKLILIIGIALIIIAPLILTRSFGIIDFIGTGEIGDTIGGITSPITGILGALLVYLALREQIKANDLIYIQFEEQKTEEKYQKSQTYISNQVDAIRQEANEFLYNTIRKQGDEKMQIDLKGTSAINETLLNCAKLNQNHFDKDIFISIPNLTKIKLLLEKFESILALINTMDFIDKDKQYLSDSIRFVYQIKLKPYLLLHEDKRMSKSKPCRNCNEVHDGIPEDIYKIYDRINDKYQL